MKKLLTLAGALVALGMFAAYAGGIANPERLNARNAVLNAGPSAAESSCPYARCDPASCPRDAKDCPLLANCPKAAKCPKASCAKSKQAKNAGDAASSCPIAKKAKATR